MQIAPESNEKSVEGVVRDSDGNVLKTFNVERDKPLSEDLGMVQIAHEEVPMTKAQKRKQKKREDDLQRSIVAELAEIRKNQGF